MFLSRLKETEQRIASGRGPDYGPGQEDSSPRSVVNYERIVATTHDPILRESALHLVANFYLTHLIDSPEYLNLSVDALSRLIKIATTSRIKEDALFNLSNQYFLYRNELELALATYQQLIREFPNTRWKRVVLDRCRLIEENMAFPKPLYFFILAERHFEKQNFPSAIRHLEELITEYPHISLAGDALYFIGDIYLYKYHDYHRGYATYSHLVRDYPEHRSAASASLKSGTCLQKLGRWQEAIDVFWDHIKNYSRNGNPDYAQYYIAQSYEALGNLEKARVSYDLILGNYPDSIWTQIARTKVSQDVTSGPSDVRNVIIKAQEAQSSSTRDRNSEDKKKERK